MKLCIVGGGGFRVPLVYGALLRRQATLGFDEIVLHDIDEARLHRIAGVLEGLAAEHGARGCRSGRTTDLEDAVEGADFVFSAIRVGELAGPRGRRDRAALARRARAGDHRPGRHLLRAADDPDHGRARRGDRAPGAAGVADQLHQPRRDGHRGRPAGARRPRGRHLRLAVGAVPARRRRARAATRRSCGSTTSGSTTWAGCAACAAPRATCWPSCSPTTRRWPASRRGRLFGGEWLRTLGMIPNEYLYYFYYAADTVDAIRESPTSRGAYLLEQQARFYSGNGQGIGRRARRLARDPPRARAHLHGRGALRGGRRRRARGRRRAGRQRRLRGRGDGGRRRDRQQHPHDADLQHRQPLGAAVPGRRRRRRGARDRRPLGPAARRRRPGARPRAGARAVDQGGRAGDDRGGADGLAGAGGQGARAAPAGALGDDGARDLRRVPARGCRSCRCASDDRRRGRHHAVPGPHLHRARRAPAARAGALRAAAAPLGGRRRDHRGRRGAARPARRARRPARLRRATARCCATTLEREGVDAGGAARGPDGDDRRAADRTATARWSPTTRARAPGREDLAALGAARARLRARGASRIAPRRRRRLPDAAATRRRARCAGRAAGRDRRRARARSSTSPRRCCSPARDDAAGAAAALAAARRVGASSRAGRLGAVGVDRRGRGRRRRASTPAPRWTRRAPATSSPRPTSGRS